jgi:hypothetical protein
LLSLVTRSGSLDAAQESRFDMSICSIGQPARSAGVEDS